MLERNPEVGPSRKDFEAGAYIRIGVAQGLKWLSIQGSGRRSVRGVLRKLLLFENSVARLFGVQSGVVEHTTQFSIHVTLGQYAQLFFSPVVVTREAKKLEQECALGHIRGVIAEIGGQLFLRFAHLP